MAESRGAFEDRLKYTIIDRRREIPITVPILAGSDPKVEFVLKRYITPNLFPGKFNLLDRHGHVADMNALWLEVEWPLDGRVTIKPVKSSKEEFDMVYQPVFSEAESWIKQEMEPVDGFAGMGWGYPTELQDVEDRDNKHEAGFIVRVMKSKASNFDRFPLEYRHERGVIPVRRELVED